MAFSKPNLQIKSDFNLMSLATIALLIAILFSTVMTFPVLAEAPAEGIVVEGLSVPGVVLGDTRAQVEASIGPTVYCQNGSSYDQTLCEYAAEGGGQIFIHYGGADGGPASASPDDIATNIRWTQQVSGWVTTAGVNTTLAYNDPDAVMAAYPNATVNTQSLFDWSIDDRALGIHIYYHTLYLTGDLVVSMAISVPDNTPPPEPLNVRVSELDLSADKRTITATAYVQDELGQEIYSALVSATWTYPDGSQLSIDGRTDRAGIVKFSLYRAKPGTYSITIDDVLADGNYVFDAANSQLSAALQFKKK